MYTYIIKLVLFPFPSKTQSKLKNSAQAFVAEQTRGASLLSVSAVFVITRPSSQVLHQWRSLGTCGSHSVVHLVAFRCPISPNALFVQKNTTLPFPALLTFCHFSTALPTHSSLHQQPYCEEIIVGENTDIWLVRFQVLSCSHFKNLF